MPITNFSPPFNFSFNEGIEWTEHRNFHKVVLEQTLDILYIFPVCVPDNYIRRTKDKQKKKEAKHPNDSRFSVLEGNDTLE